MDLTPNQPRPLWLDRFATRLGALVPGIQADTAYRYATDTFEDAADLAPEEAAAIFAAELPPGDVGAPGD